MTFERKFEFVEKLKNEPLFCECLLKDIIKGEVFPCIRKNEIHFYYKGGRLFKYDGKDFSTHIKYAFNCDQDLNDVKESELKDLKSVNNFIEGYEKIKACCEVYSTKSEACNVAKLFKNYSYVISDEDKVLLDIEAAMDSKCEDKNCDRFDLVIFDKKESALQIVEAKLYSNNEIRAKKGSTPQVVGQIQRYEYNIEQEKETIITAYKNYISVVNEIFNLDLPNPQNINKNVSLIIFNFDDKQKAKLQEEVKIINSYLSQENKIYIRGNVGADNERTILKQLF